MKKTKTEAEGKMVKTATRVDHQLWMDARILALKQGITVQELVNRAISEYVKKGGER